MGTHKNTFNFSGNIDMVKQLFTDHAPPRARRVTLTCTDDRYRQITGRTDNNSRYLETALEVLEAYIGREGRLNKQHLILITKLINHAPEVIDMLEHRQDPEADLIHSLMPEEEDQ